MMQTADQKPLVSVIVPTCRRDDPAWLRECVGSALAQTHPNLECIVVVDGEVLRETRAYLEQTAAADPRVRVLELERKAGQARARNAGIAAARGEYIAMLDSDDAAVPERLERQLDFLQATRADVAGSWYELVDGEGRLVGRKRVPTGRNGIRRWLFLLNPVGNSTVLAKAEVLKRHPYPERRDDAAGVFGEDYALWVALALKGYSLRNQPECLVRFRVDGVFFSKRRGWLQFRTDLATKLRAVRLHHPLLWPLTAAGAVATSLARLLPAPVVAGLYRVAGKMKFG